MTDINKGLSTEEVTDRVNKGLLNVAVKNQSKTIGQIIASNVFTYFNLVFAIFATLLILVRSYVNMTFLPIIICNTLIGIIQEIRSKKVLDKLTVLSAPRTKVIRNGQLTEVDSETLVKDDLCVFDAGNQICADAVLVEGSVRVNEALVTGEADEIVKNPGDVLLSGSFIVSGKCKAVLEKVGLESFAAKLTMEAKASRKRQQTEMIRSLDKLVKVIGILIIPIGIAMFLQDVLYLGLSIKESVVSVIAALVGMIPEGLYLLASVALVVSVMRLGKKNVLVHEMACVETLARVNVLCVDKTGTITENKMSVQNIIPLKNYTEENYRPIHNLIGDLVNNMDSDNVTIATLKEYFDAYDYEKAIKVFPFSSETKYSAVQMEDGNYVLGAPEYILLDSYDKYASDIEEFAKAGSRVLVFGTYKNELNGKKLKEPVLPLALVVLNNPVRKEARETFSYFEDQNVKVKVISGDNPVTVSNVAGEAGISDSENYVDASTLKTDEEISEAALKYTVFGRVQPEQKKKLVESLKNAGKVVAMTGDGVNDVLALKAADCSVAMASGSEAASNAAHIVLLDSDFSCMPSVVLEGRRVVNNIQRSASLFLVKNIFSILMALFAMIVANKYPLYPTQLSLLGAFTIGIPAFFLALQPNKSLIKGHFLINVTLKALPAGLTDFIVVAFLTAMEDYWKIPHEQLSTMAILILIAVGISTLIRICSPFDIIRVVVCVAMVIGITFCIIFMKGLFAIYPLNNNQIMITVILMAVSVILFFIMCKVVNKCIEFFSKKSKTFKKHLGKI